MKKIITFISSALFLVSCSTTSKMERVEYTIAHGYFVRNDAPVHAPLRYDNKEDFESVFGYAAVMGKDGRPTTIDFARQSVIAIIGGETNRPTEYIPMSLTLQADTLHLTYKSKKGASTTYTMTPLLLLVVDKAKASSNIKLERQ